ERADERARGGREAVGVENAFEADAGKTLDHAAHDGEARLHEPVRDQRLALPEVDRYPVAPAHVLDQLPVDGEIARDEREPLRPLAALETKTDVADRRLDLAVTARRDDQTDRAVGGRRCVVL